MYILAGARTPFAKYIGCSRGGALKHYSSTDLAETAARAALERAGVSAKDIDHLMLGMVFHGEKDAVYTPRNLGLRLGLEESVPALLLQRNCASGLQAVVSGAMEIALKKAEVVLCCGAESMSNIPHVVRGLREEGNFRHFNIVDFLTESLEHSEAETSMPGTAENIAKKYGITRAMMDQFAFESHQRAAGAKQQGIFDEEITPLPELSYDDAVRENIVLEKLSNLPPAFNEQGSVTAGNACGISDGAAALLLASADYVKQSDSPVLGKIVDWAVVGLDPALMGLGPVPAIRKLLAQTGKTLSDIDLLEVNEAFAAQYLGVEKELELDRTKVNVNGGAIALGHPLGATGVRLILTLLLELRRRKLKIGIAAMCIGGGQGMAVMVELV